MLQRLKSMLKNMSKYVQSSLGIHKKCATYTLGSCTPNRISQLIDIKRSKSGISMPLESNLRPSFLATVQTKTEAGSDSSTRGQNTTELLSQCLKITTGILGSTRQSSRVKNGLAGNRKAGFRQ